MDALTQDSVSIAAEIARLRSEQLALVGQLEALTDATAHQDGMPTLDQAIEHSSLQLRLSAIPPMLANLEVRHKQAEIDELWASLAASESPFAAAVEDYERVTRDYVEMKHILEIWKSLQIWLNKYYRQPLDDSHRQRVAQMQRLHELGAVSAVELNEFTERVIAIRRYPGDTSQAQQAKEFALVEMQIKERYGLDVPQSEKVRWVGWGKPFMDVDPIPDRAAHEEAVRQGWLNGLAEERRRAGLG